MTLELGKRTVAMIFVCQAMILHALLKRTKKRMGKCRPQNRCCNAIDYVHNGLDYKRRNQSNRLWFMRTDREMYRGRSHVKRKSRFLYHIGNRVGKNRHACRSVRFPGLSRVGSRMTEPFLLFTPLLYLYALFT